MYAIRSYYAPLIQLFMRSPRAYVSRLKSVRAELEKPDRMIPEIESNDSDRHSSSLSFAGLHSVITSYSIHYTKLYDSGSELFKRTFEEGMSMVEETATYLDGKGRAESKLLPSKAALAYAGESMRLTTRLMQLASWLLLHRAVKEGEMSLVV